MNCPQEALNPFSNKPLLSPTKKAAGDMVIVSVRLSVPHFCPEHISKSIWDINFKPHKWIDLIKEACSVQEPLLYLHYFWSYCPLYIFFWNFCPEHISKSMKARNLKLHTHIELIEEACSAQDPLLYLQYFWSYCPLYIFTLNFCQEHISKSIKARNLKLHTYIELIEEKCSAQQP